VGTLTRQAIETIGFASVGDNVLIDDAARFYGAQRITIGSNVRVDAYCVLSAGPGGIVIGNHVHLAVYVSLIGAGRIEIKDFGNISGRVSIYSSTDDFHGQGLTGPTVPPKLRNVLNAPVTIGRHVVIGTGSVILPGVEIGDGASVGALSLIKRNVQPFMIVAGPKARVIGERTKDFLKLEAKLHSEPH